MAYHLQISCIKGPIILYVQLNMNIERRQTILNAHEASHSVAIAESPRAGVLQWRRRSGIATVRIAEKVRLYLAISVNLKNDLHVEHARAHVGTSRSDCLHARVTF